MSGTVSPVSDISGLAMLPGALKSHAERRAARDYAGELPDGPQRELPPHPWPDLCLAGLRALSDRYLAVEA